MPDEPQEHRERFRPGWGCVILFLMFLLPAGYVLSPPFVAMACGGRDTFDKTQWLWMPLGWLEINSDLYRWYLESWPDWVWR